MKVEKGKTVKVEYKGTFEDGEVFDSSEGRGPLEVKAGVGHLIKGFDRALIGMEIGQEKDVMVLPEEGYGDYNLELIKDIPKNRLPANVELKEGMMLAMQTPDGHRLPALIKMVGTDVVKIDLNHPLAGKKLNFHLKVVGISDKEPEDSCGCGHEH